MSGHPHPTPQVGRAQGPETVSLHGCLGRFWEVVEGRGAEGGGAGLSLWEDEELDKADEAEDQQRTGHIGSKAGVHLPRVLRERRLSWVLGSGLGEAGPYQGLREEQQWPRG